MKTVRAIFRQLSELKVLFRAGFSSDIETVICVFEFGTLLRHGRVRGGEGKKLNYQVVVRYMSGHNTIHNTILCQCQIDLQQPKKLTCRVLSCKLHETANISSFYVNFSIIEIFAGAWLKYTFFSEKWDCCLSGVNEKLSVGIYQLSKQKRKTPEIEIVNALSFLSPSIDVKSDDNNVFIRWWWWCNEPQECLPSIFLTFASLFL